MAEWNEADHPRDEKGQFTGGGGGPSAGLPAWAGKRVGEHSGPRKWTEKIPEGLLRDKNASETWHGHFDQHPDKGGVPVTAERQKLHDEIIRSSVDRVKPVAPGDQKHAILTMGGPASGKSSILKGIDTSQFVKVDPDAIKERLPEYQKATSHAVSYKGAAAMAHEESSYLAKKVRAEAIAAGKHMIIDGTGADAAKFNKLIGDLKSRGYHVTVMMPHLDQAEGMKRAKDRAEHSGRYVPDHFVEEAYGKIPKNAGAIAREAHEFRMFDAGKKGSPVAYERHADGSETIHDHEFVKDFRARHGL